MPDGGCFGYGKFARVLANEGQKLLTSAFGVNLCQLSDDDARHLLECPQRPVLAK